jgi:hypothetical protein
MISNQMKQSSPGFLRLQANRCQQLSRSCMDLGTARALRLMAEEYSTEAARPEARKSASDSQPRAPIAKMTRMVEPSLWRLPAVPAGTLQGPAIVVDTGALVAGSPVVAPIGGLNIVKH